MAASYFPLNTIDIFANLSVIAKLTLVVKSDHVYRCGANIDQEFTSILEPENVNNLGRNAIKVIGNTQTIGHIPEKLAQKLPSLMREGQVQEVVAKVTGTSRPAPFGMWVQGGGIEIPCKYMCEMYLPKINCINLSS